MPLGRWRKADWPMAGHIWDDGIPLDPDHKWDKALAIYLLVGILAVILVACF